MCGHERAIVCFTKHYRPYTGTKYSLCLSTLTYPAFHSEGLIPMPQSLQRVYPPEWELQRFEGCRGPNNCFLKCPFVSSSRAHTEAPSSCKESVQSINGGPKCASVVPFEILHSVYIKRAHAKQYKRNTTENTILYTTMLFSGIQMRPPILGRFPNSGRSLAMPVHAMLQPKWKAWFIMSALWAICCLMDYKLLRSTQLRPHYCLITLSRHEERLIAVLVNRGIFGHQSLMRKTVIEWNFLHAFTTHTQETKHTQYGWAAIA